MSFLRSAYRAAGRTSVALGLPHLWLRGRPEERRERLGFSPRRGEARPLWIHAASLGEASAAGALVDAMRAREDVPPLAISAMTRTGRERVATFAPDLGPFHPPLDVPGPVRRSLDRLDPRAFVALETELWPVLLEELAGRSVPWAVASARISARSFDRMRRLRHVVRPLLETTAAIAARTEVDAERFRELGAPAEAVAVTGDLKEDQPLPTWSPLPTDRARWLAACTRPGEEAIVLEALAMIARELPEGELVLAPRHPERFEEARALVRAAGWPCRSWRERNVASPASAWGVVLVDEMGVLGEAYARAGVAFVGGSLVPLRGHTPLEAAAAARPVVMGPHRENCLDLATRLERVGALETASTAAELAARVTARLRAPEAAAEDGRAGRRVLEAASGVAARTLRHLVARGAW
ncbi:MAG: glycosyltransferase N-terminal domain-containing protein [bacterium]